MKNTLKQVVNKLNQVADGAEYQDLLNELVNQHERMIVPILQLLEGQCVCHYLEKFAEIYELARKRSGDEKAVINQHFLKGLDFHTTEFLRRQVSFVATGEYQASDARRIQHDVYLCDDIMKQYLDGLLLTYVTWPNQYRTLQFYEDEYLKNGVTGDCLDIGPGHGYLTYLQIKASPDSKLVAFDVSPHSVDYCRGLLSAGSLDNERYEIICGDFFDVTENTLGAIFRVTVAEVLEHVKDPLSLLKKAVSVSNKNAVFFISTCINIEAIDHIYRFTTVDDVNQLIMQSGLVVENELVLPLSVSSGDMLCANYASICRVAT